MDYLSEDERIRRIYRNELRLDDPDEGFESSSNTMDTEIIIIERMYPLPRRPPFQVLYSSDEEEEDEHIRGGRRLYDRYPHTVETVSRGDDDEHDPSSELRNHFINTRTNGDGISGGFIMTATKITGLAVKEKKIVYFLMWENNGRISYALDENLMRWGYPDLVMDFHEQLIMNPQNYIFL